MLSSIRMPQMGVSDESALLSKWLVREGDRVRKGQPVFSLETDKATFQYEAESDGILVRILTCEDEEANVGSPVGILSDTGTFEESELEELLREQGNLETKPQSRNGTATTVRHEDKTESIADADDVHLAPAEKQKVSPRARKKATELGLNINTLGSGSGPDGRILERDIWNAVRANRADCGTERKTNRIHSGRPLTSADRIKTRSFRAENAGQSGFVSRLVDARRILAECASRNDLTPGAVICRELAQLLTSDHELNARRHGDRIYEYKSVHLRLNVETAFGPLRPVIRCAESYTSDELAILMRNAFERCIRFASKPREFQDGTFTVTDMSEYGADCFTPELTPPELCALGIGAITTRIKADARGGIEAYPAIRLTLAYDRAGMDTFRAAKFLNGLAARLKQGEKQQANNSKLT